MHRSYRLEFNYALNAWISVAATAMSLGMNDRNEAARSDSTITECAPSTP